MHIFNFNGYCQIVEDILISFREGNSSLPWSWLLGCGSEVFSEVGCSPAVCSRVHSSALPPLLVRAQPGLRQRTQPVNVG